MESKYPDPNESQPLEFFLLARRIHRGITQCASGCEALVRSDVCYLWLQLGTDSLPSTLHVDQYLNIIDEAASLGVNWLVITLGEATCRKDIRTLCNWAQDTHGMVVCLHAPSGELAPAERELLGMLNADSTFLLVEPEHAAHFGDMEAAGVRIALAKPAGQKDGAPCTFPNKMIFVDPEGRLYTCGLVAGEADFFLGSVFESSMDEIMHNPKLPHVISTAEPTSERNCSGCPPLVAKYLCNH